MLLTYLNQMLDADSQIETLPRYWPFTRGIHRSPVNSPKKGQWRGALRVFYLRLNKQLSKHWWGWEFETPSSPLWRHSNVDEMLTVFLSISMYIVVHCTLLSEGSFYVNRSLNPWILNALAPNMPLTLRPRKFGPHFPDDIFKCIFFSEKISLRFVPNGPINNIPALIQIMALRRPGDKPLSEAMLVSLLTHKCVTCPQWVSSSWLSGGIWQ